MSGFIWSFLGFSGPDPQRSAQKRAAPVPGGRFDRSRIGTGTGGGSRAAQPPRVTPLNSPENEKDFPAPSYPVTYRTVLPRFIPHQTAFFADFMLKRYNDMSSVQKWGNTSFQCVRKRLNSSSPAPPHTVLIMPLRLSRDPHQPASAHSIRVKLCPISTLDPSQVQLEVYF